MKHWSGMMIQSDGSKPHVVFAMTRLADNFPYIIFKIGGMVDRNVRGSNVKSLHASGRAMDIYLDVKYPQEKALGTILYDVFKSNAEVLKTNHVIFNWNEWYSTGDSFVIKPEDKRGPHTDHVHVDFHDDQMDREPVALVNLLRAAATSMRMQGYKNWMDGLYGPAFHPLHRMTHLTSRQRRAIWTLNTGQVAMDVSPGYMRDVAAMQKLGKLVRVGDPDS